MASEFGEEAYQFVIGEEAMHFGDVMAGIAEDSNFSSRFGEYVSDGEFWTSGFFGAIGAGVMQGTKPVFDKIRGKTVEDSRIKELEERGAKFAYHNKKLRAAAESGLPDVYEQAMLDASTDMAVTAAKEGNIDHYVEQLEQLKTADAETREKMGVDETFTENIDRLVSDAQAIKKIWNKNINRFDPSILPQVVQSKFVISKLDGDRGKLINQINEDRNSIHRYNELSADGRNVFDAKLKIKSAEKGVEHAKKILADKSKKLTEEQKGRIQEYINQQEGIIAAGNAEVSAIEADDNITLPDSDKEILKLLNNEAIIGEAVSNMEKLSWQDQLIDAHIMRLNKLTNREIVKEAAKHKANLDKGREDFRRVQDLYTQIHKGAKEEILGKRKTIGIDEEGKPIKEESEDYENVEGLTQRYEVELTPKEKQDAINEAKEILARTTDKKDRENIAKMIEAMETVVRDGISRFQRQETKKAKALQELENKRLNRIKRLNATAKGLETKRIKTEIALAYDQYAMIDHAYDDTPLGELFFKNTDVLQVFHNGERGILYKSDDTNEVVFQSSSSGEEFIISGSLESTISDVNLGIARDSYFPVDITVAGDTMSIWIGDSELSHIGTMPQESLNYDEAGNLKSVTLVNGKGEEVEITGEILMYEVADVLLAYQLAIEQFLGKDQTFTIGDKEYQVNFNATNPMQSKVSEVLRDEKGEILMTEEVLPGKRNIYNKDGSLNKKGRILNEITGEFREQLIKDIVGYTEGDIQFAPRIQLERETVRETVRRGEGPIAKKPEDIRYAIKGTNKWILKEQNEEVTDTEDVPTEPPGGPTDEKGPDETKPKGESTKNPKTEEDITDQLIDPDISESELQTKAISKIFDELEPNGSKLTEELKNTQSIEDLQGLLNEKIQELASSSNVNGEGLPITKVGTDEEGDLVVPINVMGRSAIGVTAEGEIIGEEISAIENIPESSLSPEEKDQLEADIKRIKDFISKVETEFATIKDEAIRAQLEAEEKLKRESTVLIDEDVEIGDVIIELTSNPKGLKKVEENGNRYYEDKDGNKYIGMSSIVNPSDFVDEKGEWTGAAPIGTAVDSVLRNFFAGKPTEYTGEIAKRMSEEAYNELLKTAEEFKESLKDEDGSLDHIEFLTEGLFIANNDIKASQKHINKFINEFTDSSRQLRKQEFGIATEMDMVIVNKKTNTVELVDFKTVRLGRYTIPENKLEKEWDGKSKKDGYTKQQNASRIILELNTRIKFEALSLLPIGLEYDKNDQQTSEAKVSSELMPLDKLEIDEVFPEEYAKQILDVFTSATDAPPSTLEVEDTEEKRPELPKGFRYVEEGEIIPAGDYTTRLSVDGKRTITNAPKQSEPSFELPDDTGPSPKDDTKKSRSTQQDTNAIEGSIQTKTYQYEERRTEGGQTVLVFDSSGNPKVKEGLGIQLNTDLLANPNLIKEGGKIYLQPLMNNHFQKMFVENDSKAEPNYFMHIPIIVYLENENGEKQPIGVLKAENDRIQLSEEEANIRLAIYNNWIEKKKGYTIGNLVTTNDGTVVGYTRGPNLRTVKDENDKSVLKPIAERWTAMYQTDEDGNIVLHKNENIEFKFGYVNKPLEGAPVIVIPGVAEKSALDLAARNLGTRPFTEAGQVWGFVLNGNNEHVPVKVSTSNIDKQAHEVVMNTLTTGKKVTEEDIKKIQEIIYTEYQNYIMIQSVAPYLFEDQKIDKIDPTIQILWNSNTTEAYVQFIHNGIIYSLDVKDLNNPNPNIKRKKIENTKDGNPSIVVDDTVDSTFILNELKHTPVQIISEIIKKKKYNIKKLKLNSKADKQYTSPITGQTYENYNDYLIGRRDRNGEENREVLGGSAILQTDIQPSDGGNYFYDTQLQIEIGEQRFQEENSEVEKEVAKKEEIDEDEDDDDFFPDLQAPTDPPGTIGGIPSMSPLGRFNMFLNKFNIQLSGFSSMKPGKVSQITQQFKNEAKVFGLEGRVSTNGSLYLYDPSAKKALVKNNSPSNNPNFKLKLSRVKPIKTDYPYQTTRTRTGRTIFQLGITPIQWATTPRKEKENIINCN